ncbi:MAG: ice-binding family protein [Rhodocyclaceae bacterium]|nr:ice-binding family protein [Rhodocyclaceae bacterium]
MKITESYSRFSLWLMTLLLSAIVAGCGGGGGGGGRDPILGIGGIAVLGPTVTAVAPVNNATGVPISTKVVTAAFSKAMDPATLTTASFTLACGAAGTAGVVGSPQTPVTGGGAVTYLAAGSVATLPLPLATDLPASADCTATVTTAAKDTTNVALAANFVWTFATGVTPDTTRPRVTLTVPATTSPGPTLGAIANAAITAVFTEDMVPASITTAGTFTVTCGPGNVAPCVAPAAVGGAATYAIGSRTATYTPTVALAASTTYTATITTTATDIALNALAGNQALLPAASDYVWTFTTAAALIPPAPITVISTNPDVGAGGVCPNATVNATFNASAIRMDDASVAANFSVTGPGATVVTPASVVLDGATGRVATFTPLAVLPVGLYTAKITGGASGVKDLAITPNTMASDFSWTFTVVPATGACLVPVSLGAAAPFGVFGGAAGMTNMGNLTVINGDIGTIATGTSSITGFHDAPPALVSDSYTEVCPGTPLLGTGCGLVAGTIYTCTVSSIGRTSAISIGPATQDPVACGIATAALGAAGTAYGILAGLAPVGASPAPGANLAGVTLFPGVYAAPGGSFQILGGDLTLDPQGNADAVWVFQMASTLTVGAANGGAPQSVILIPPAQAKNVFWQVGTSAVINAPGGGTMVGTIITGGPPPGIAFSTAGNATPVTLNGRAMTTTVTGASVTLVNTIINVPAP